MVKGGNIFLSGGGNWDKTIEIDSYFLNMLDNRKILFIPIAKDTDIKGYYDCLEWFKDKLAKLGNKKDIVINLNLNNIKNLDNYSAVYIGGGNTYRLLKLIRESNFDKVLKKYIDSGGIYYAPSAGAVLAGKDISLYIEENKSEIYNNEFGLNMIGNYSIICHFDNSLERIYTFFSRKNTPIIAIPTGTAILIKDKRVFVVGEGVVKVFYHNGLVLDLKKGNHFDML